MSDEQAIETLLSNIDGELINQPRVIKYQTGTRRKHWNKNCIAIGLSSGFIEPLESTGIHLFQRGIIRLMQMLPQNEISTADIEEFNTQATAESNNIRDFIVLHYHLTERNDSEFWRYCKNMEIPESLAHRMKLFKETSRVFKKPDDLFGESSWVQVMLGQGLMPEQYHPIVDQMSDQELSNFLNTIKEGTKKQVKNWPNHWDFIQHYCKSKAM